MNRRDVLKTAGLVSGLAIAPSLSFALSFAQQKKPSANFKFCLNTSTIRGQKPGLQKSIEIAAKAGYDSLELWVGDVAEFKDQGNSLKTLKKFLDDNHLTVEDAIGFAPWMVDDEKQREAGFAKMKQDMEL